MVAHLSFSSSTEQALAGLEDIRRVRQSLDKGLLTLAQVEKTLQDIASASSCGREAFQLQSIRSGRNRAVPVSAGGSPDDAQSTDPLNSAEAASEPDPPQKERPKLVAPVAPHLNASVISAAASMLDRSNRRLRSRADDSVLVRPAAREGGSPTANAAGSLRSSTADDAVLAEPSGVPALQPRWSIRSQNMNAGSSLVPSGRNNKPSPTAYATSGFKRCEMTAEEKAIEEQREEQKRSGGNQFDLPADWPKCVQPRKELDQAFQESEGDAQHLMELSIDFYRHLGTKETLLAQFSWLHTFVLYPHHPLRIFLDIWGMVALAFDCCAIPVILAWEIEFTGWIQVVSFANLIFWTADIFFTFHSCTYVNGVLVEKLNEIAHHYLHSWFFCDFILVTVDWIGMLLTLLTETVQVSSSIKMLRIGKAARLARLGRVLNFDRLQDALECVSQSYLRRFEIMTALIKMFAFIFWLNHIIACIWYVIGVHAESDTGVRWIDLLPSETSDNFDYYAYWTALHWSMTQMTPGSMSITAGNTIERQFNIFCLVMGMMFFSSVLSAMTSRVAEYRKDEEKTRLMFKQFRRYLKQRGVGMGGNFALAAQRQLMQRLSTQPPLKASDVSAIVLLSHPLKVQLAYECYHAHLMKNPIWRWWMSEDLQAAQNFCYEALDHCIMPGQDKLISPGDQRKEALVLITGKVLYLQEVVLAADPGKSSISLEPTLSDECTVVTDGAWICEAALWVNWTCVGLGVTQSLAEFVVVKTTNLVQAHPHPMVRRVLTEYGKAVHNAVVSAHPPLTSWPNDLHVPRSSLADLLPSMSLYTRQALASQVVKKMHEDWSKRVVVTTGFVKNLLQDVMKGRSMLMLDGNGEVERLSSIVCVCVQRPDGRQLVQLGCWEDGRFKAKVQLPGTKQRYGETAGDSLDRLLQGWMRPMSYALSFQGSETLSETRHSTRIWMRTTSTRTMNRASIPQTWNEFQTVSLAGVVEDPQVASGFPEELYVVREGNRKLALAWLTPEECERHTNNEDVLRHWIRTVPVPVLEMEDGQVDDDCNQSSVGSGSQSVSASMSLSKTPTYLQDEASPSSRPRWVGTVPEAVEAMPCTERINL